MEKDDLVIGAVYLFSTMPNLRRLVSFDDAEVTYDIHDDGTDDLFKMPIRDFLERIDGRIE